jgi:hypothetical protein
MSQGVSGAKMAPLGAETGGPVIDGAGAPIDPGKEIKGGSGLDRAIWSEKLKGASDLEISLRLRLDVDVVRRRLRGISRPREELALIKEHTDALCEEMSAVWQRWLDEAMPESMKTTLLFAIVMNVAVRSLTPLVSAVAIAGSRGGLGPTRHVGRALIDSVCDGLRRRVDGMIADEQEERRGPD